MIVSKGKSLLLFSMISGRSLLKILLLDKLGLPADKDCKVVVTTRNEQVALNSGARIYQMKNLSDEDSWRLFCIYAFPHDNVGNKARMQMEEEGRKIVRKCGNLPLAIKTVAASLANCKDLSKWELKRRQPERVVSTIGDPGPVIPILKLSYDSLPPHLKPCFAYLSFFPEDELISAEYLINLWIAERFIPEGEGENQWEIGFDCLDQLSQLCLVQTFEEDHSRKYCKIHDLLYDLPIQVSKEKDECVFCIEKVSPYTSGARGWCRILLAKKGLHDLTISKINPVHLRTLSLSKNGEIRATMRGLRILDLSFTNITALPVSLGKMILLKLLNLRETKITEVPDYVRHMKSLFFLALPVCCGDLPEWIGELKCLQNLECRGIDSMPKGISKLTSLRTLRSYLIQFSIKEDEFLSLDDLADMAQLQELYLVVNHEMQLKRLEEGILAHLLKMRHLHIRNKVPSANDEEMELPKFPKKMRAMKHLEMLKLEGFTVPRWIYKFQNLREIDLRGFEFSDCPQLQILPYLQRLQLRRNKKCKELPMAFGRSGGFPQLRFLTIENFRSLKEFPDLEDGVMPFLQQFNLWYCSNVMRFEGLERLKKLERFHGEMMNESWKTLTDGGEYWNKIKAINPHVSISIWVLN